MKPIKLLVTLLMTIMLSVIIGNTAYASEIVPKDSGNENLDDSNVYFDELGQIHELDNNDDEKELDEITYIDEEGSEEDDLIEESEKAIKKDASEKQVKVQKQPKQEKKEPVVKKPSYTEKELRLLASLIYAEAGNQPYKGKLAVANIVLNRAKSDIYWHVKTVEEVIYDKKWSVQFSVTIKNKKTGISPLDRALKYYDTGKFGGGNPEAEKKAMKSCIKAAKAALEGENNIGDYLCFTANRKGTSSIKKRYPNYEIIGNHIFYRTK